MTEIDGLKRKLSCLLLSFVVIILITSISIVPRWITVIVEALAAIFNVIISVGLYYYYRNMIFKFELFMLINIIILNNL